MQMEWELNNQTQTLRSPKILVRRAGHTWQDKDKCVWERYVVLQQKNDCTTNNVLVAGKIYIGCNKFGFQDTS